MTADFLNRVRKFDSCRGHLAPSTISEVVEQLRAREAAGPRSDGVACFARLDLGIDPGEHSPEHGDFEHVNQVLAQVEARLKRSCLTGWVGRVDRLVHRFHRIDDIVAMWDVGRARDAAWTNGQALWALRDEPPLAAEFLLALDRMVGLASRGFLIPADSSFRRLARIRRI